MNSSYVYALVGGILIGLSAALILWLNGRILGVSGIVGGAFRAKSWDLYWRLIFIMGMFVGGLLIEPFGFSIMNLEMNRSLSLVAIGGLLVGLGTCLGNGCTSGHGVCGIARLSLRSLVATFVFMLSGIVSVAILNRFLGAL